MWSVGCILVEIFTGKPLFNGCTSNSDLAKKMVKLLGPIPKCLQNGKYYYTNCITSNTNDGTTYIKLCNLLKKHDHHFITFIQGLLEFDPKKRLTPQQALLHPFLSSLFPFSAAFGEINYSQQKSILQQNSFILQQKNERNKRIKVWNYDDNNKKPRINSNE